jgi:NTE family protein
MSGRGVAVVLSGAAARGAFQAGALEVLVPVLAAQGLRPTIWLGTSAGSINAVLWGARAHLDPAEAGADVVSVWQRMSDDDVYEPLSVTAPRLALQFAGGALLGRGPGTTSLLDTAPLRRTAEQMLHTDLLEANLVSGAVAACGVVATRMPGDGDSDRPGTASGRSVLFLDEHEPSGYDGDSDRALDVVRGPLRAEHVLASSAIPVAFPPVELPAPAGWYVDGGVRLNTPLHPAIGLDADRVLVVSATATSYPPPAPGPVGGTPDIADAAAQLLHAALADRTVEDLRALRRTNRQVGAAARAGRRDLLVDGEGRPYRTVPLMAVSPPAGAMGRAADRIFTERTRGLGRFTELDNWVIGKALRGAGDTVGRRELLSYLFFDEEYFAASVELGRAAATDALAAGWESDS